MIFSVALSISPRVLINEVSFVGEEHVPYDKFQ